MRRAIKSTKNKKVGVIGTEATIQSGAYTHALKAADGGIEVYSRACPLFVPLVEEGWTDNEVVEMTVKPILRFQAKRYRHVDSRLHALSIVEESHSQVHGR